MISLLELWDLEYFFYYTSYRGNVCRENLVKDKKFHYLSRAVFTSRDVVISVLLHLSVSLVENLVSNVLCFKIVITLFCTGSSKKYSNMISELCLWHCLTGMEAIWKVEVENFPAFIVVDDKGNDFFKEWQVE